jgi:guanyl-specific ribonuclease Sa
VGPGRPSRSVDRRCNTRRSVATVIACLAVLVGQQALAGVSLPGTPSFGVAAKAADHLISIGPAPEKAWAVLERVSAKGAPLQGYKGGGKFENVGKGARLPDSGPGGPITYREWDVNPYVKGVNWGAERLVTGSDGSAYYTRDHYDTFVRFR